VPYDPSVSGRLRLYRASMEALLNPGTRGRKVSLLDEPIRIDAGPRTLEAGREKKIFGLALEFPAGLPASTFGSFQHKAFVRDLVLARTDPAALRSGLVARFGASRAEKMAGEIRQMADELLKHPEGLLTIAKARLETIDALYLSCGGTSENDGHRFGESLAAADKKALIAFLATL
jgi:hypothetical protein